MDQSATKTTAFFMLGAAAGAALMALATPRNGREVRDKIMESVRTGKKKTEDSLDNFDENIHKVSNAARDKVANLKTEEVK